MAQIFDPIDLPPGSPIPSLSMLMGSYVQTDVFANINNFGFKSHFGEEFDRSRDEFFARYVNPMNQVAQELSSTINAIMNPDQFRILNSIEAFRSIPLCMELPIAMFTPVRQGIINGLYDGFGYDVDSLPKEDVFGRLIDNFTCENVQEASDDEGFYPIEATFSSDDPDLSDDALYAIRLTREYILRHIIDETDRDPTSIDSPVG